MAQRKLDKIYKLLKLKGWCQGTDAEDKNGDDVEFNSPNACKFCFAGAMERVYTGKIDHDGVSWYAL